MCKTSSEIPLSELEKNFSKVTVEKHFGHDLKTLIYFGKGCKICHDTGFSGRIGVFEVLEVTKGIKKMIVEKNDADLIVKQAILEGMSTMLDDGLNKVAKGLTTLEETS